MKNALCTGAMRDPYMLLEGTLQYTRRAMETALKHQCGFSFITILPPGSP